MLETVFCITAVAIGSFILILTKIVYLECLLDIIL